MGNQSNEVVFVDAAVDDIQSYLGELKPGIEVVILDADRDGVEQIAQVLGNRNGLDANVCDLSGSER